MAALQAPRIKYMFYLYAKHVIRGMSWQVLLQSIYLMQIDL